jgi:DNA-binding HxlR family transcriptional regulator
MLIIAKQTIREGRETCQDFAESEEAIATNVLSTQLNPLEKVGIILKTPRPNNKKTKLYLLTDRGLVLTTFLSELAS